MKKINHVLILSLIFTIIGYNHLIAQQIIYVATTGNNSTGDGSLGSPFQTLQYALAQCNESDTIELREGTYYTNGESIRIDVSDITIRSYPHEWAVISAPYDDAGVAMTLWYHSPDVDGGKLERLEITGGYYYALKFESNWDWGLASRYGTSNITVKNCKIHNSGRDCIKITPGCNNITIESCEIYNSGIGPANSGDPNAEGIDCVNGTNIVVRNCYIHDVSTNGLYLKGGAQNGIIESNLITDCGSGGILFGFKGTDYEWFDLDANPNLHGNINGIIRNNIITRTSNEAIGLYAVLNAKVYNNTSIDASSIYHSAFYISRGEVWVSNATGTVYPYSENVDVRNNIFMNISSTSNPVASFRVENNDPSSNLQGTNIIDYNIYYQEGGSSFDDDIHGETDIAGWKTNTGFDEHSVAVNPNLDANYHLSSSSTDAIDKGIELSEVLEDYDGASRTAPYDIGADEYGAGDILVVPPTDGVLGTGGTVTAGGSTTGTNDFSLKNNTSLRIYPVPASNEIKLNIYTEVNQKATCFISDLSGKKLQQYNFELTGNTTNQKNIPINKLQSGIYFISIKLAKNTITKQFIKTEK